MDFNKAYADAQHDRYTIVYPHYMDHIKLNDWTQIDTGETNLRRAGFLYSFLPFGWIRMDVCEDCFWNMKEYCEDHAGGKENE